MVAVGYWSGEEVQILLAMTAEGFSDSKIAERIGRSKGAVRHQRKSIGLAANFAGTPRPADFTPEKARRAKNVLCKEYGVSHTVIQRWRAELGVHLTSGETRTKQLPDDFAENYKHMRIEDLRKHYGVAHATVVRWIDESGLQRRFGRLPLPRDFAEIAPKMTRRELMAHYDVSDGIITRWLNEANVLPKPALPPQNQKREIPEGFAIDAQRIGLSLLAAIYGVGKELVRKWRLQLGIKPPELNRPMQGRLYSVSKTLSTPGIGMGEAATAAHYLRRFFPIVARVEYCDARLRKEHPKDHYVVGKLGVFSPEQVIELARKHDWNPDAWRQVA